MIQYFIDLPIEKQTWSVLALSWLLVTVSAAIRERVKATECRNWARAMGVVGVGLVSLQAIHATMVAEELNTELMVRRGMHDVQQTEAVATQIANPVRVVAVASEFSRTVGNSVVSITRYSDGRFGSVSVTGGRGGGIRSSGQQSNQPIAGSDGTAFHADHGRDGMSNAESGIDF